jgi:hypothetical protein
LKIKLKGSHFNANEVIEAESQAVLNTLTEHDFEDAFEHCQKRWERDHFEGDGGQKAQSQVLTRWQHKSRKVWMTLCRQRLLANVQQVPLTAERPKMVPKDRKM